MEIRRSIILLCVFTILLTAVPVLSDAGMKVLALFPGKAMVNVNGKRVFLKKGKTVSGVKLIRADSESALIEVNGQRDTYRLGSHIGTSYRAKSFAEAKILRRGKKGYLTDGKINGRGVTMLVDTGATSVAMSETQARAIGLPYLEKGRRTAVSTASGTANAYEINLNEVKVGAIKLHNVSGVVIEGNSPMFVLLVMSFLSQVKMDDQGELLVLRERF